MDQLEERARHAVRGLGQRGRTQRIPDSVRAVVLDYARRQRAGGVPWDQIGKAVGLSGTVIALWANEARPAQARLLPVRLATASPPRLVPSPVVLVAPGGYRIEGLTLANAIDVLRALR